jgi:hypothetical protein
MGGIGAVAEPLVVIALLIGGTWINRSSNPGQRRRPRDVRRISSDLRAIEEIESLINDDVESRSASPSLLGSQEPKWRKRTVGIFGVRKEVVTPNTRRFQGYFLSRLLERFPFLVECWYWALIYWVSCACHHSCLRTDLCRYINSVVQQQPFGSLKAPFTLHEITPSRSSLQRRSCTYSGNWVSSGSSCRISL